MNARTIRRAIERKADKQARKEARQEAKDLFTTQREALTAELEAGKATLAQLQANRRNAQLSTGPTSSEGKVISSRNALKTGLTGRTVLLPSDDGALYQEHVGGFFDELNPVGAREIELTQSIADSKWRLARIPGLEFGIYALGRIEFAEEFANHPKAEAAALIEARTFMAYQRQLNNLSIQESRLRRQCEKDTAELARLQELRAQADRAAAVRKPAASSNASKPQPPAIGFEFSPAPLEAFTDRLSLDSDALTLPQAA